MNLNLDQSVLQMLDARRGDWQAVAEQSGVSYSWLSKFANGHIANPGFATLVKLANALDVQGAGAIEPELVQPTSIHTGPAGQGA